MFKSIVSCFYQAAVNTINHDGVEHAGYMAFLTLLSIFPFLFIIVAITGFVGESSIGTKLVEFTMANLPYNVSIALSPRVDEIVSGPPQSLMTLAIFGAIWTASSAVEGLRTVLNRVYQVKTPPPYIWRRLLSIAQFLILTSVIIVIMLILIIGPIMWEKFINIGVLGETLYKYINFNPIWDVLRYVIVVGTLLVAVCIIYYTLPNHKLRWMYILPGAVLVVILWFLGGALLSIYLNNFKQVNVIYGSLGGVIISLIFFYIINMILIFGAEYNYLIGTIIEKKYYGHN